MNKKLLSITIASAGLILAACGGKGDNPPSPVFPAEFNDGVHAITINNAAEMSADWEVGGSSRQLDISIAENGQAKNVATELSKGTLKFVIKDAGVVTNSGLKFFSGETVAQTTVAIVYSQTVKHLPLNIIAKKSIKDKYRVAHEGTELDPFTNEDAITVTKGLLDEDKNTEFVMKGEVESFYHAPGSRTDGAVSWYMKPNSGTEKFEIYKCYKADGSFLTDDDVWKGAVVTARGKLTTYGDQCETSAATWIKTEGVKPEPPKTIDATVAQALEVGKALSDGDSTWDYYNVTGYVVSTDGTNFFMNDAKKVETDTKNMLELYGYNIEAVKEKLLYNAKISAKMKVKNYHGQIETGGNLAADDVVVIEAGQPWADNPEPKLVTGSIADFVANTDGNGKQLYELTGKVTKWKDAETTDGTKYGNFYMSDDDGVTELYIYGATATASALTWDKQGGVYKFKNPQDFLTNDVTKVIEIGSVVTIKASRCDFNGTVEGNGIITKVGGDEPVDLTGIELDKNTAELPLNGSLTLVASPVPAGAKLPALTWSSSDTSVATVADGVVTPVAKGDAVITVSCSDGKGGTLSDICKVTVVEASSSVTVKAAYVGVGTTTKFEAGKNNAALIGLDDKLFDVSTNECGQYKNPIGCNKDGTIRLYANKADGEGNVLGVSLTGGTIKSIVIEKGSTGAFTQIEVKAGESVVSGSEGAYSIDASSFSIKNAIVDENVQFWILSITIVYELA